MREDEEWGQDLRLTPHSFALAPLVCERKVSAMRRLVLLVVIGWIVLVTVLHLWLNLHAFVNHSVDTVDPLKPGPTRIYPRRAAT
jgi:hypothetical protein